MAVITRDLRTHHVGKAYDRWAIIYDQLCGPIFRPAHRAAAAAANAAGRDILEIGVGTGLLLPLYAPDARVTGIDLSERMLARAKTRIHRLGPGRSIVLEQGDAHVIAHPDASYDAIVMPFILPLLAQPERALGNALRMLRPGGSLIIVSRFRSRRQWLADIEARLAPLLAPIGLRPDFPLERVHDWCAGAPVARIAVTGIGHVFSLVRITRQG
jgi:phosphatidylethanolamine/phosphatidyl-N-methylethanolamine N-methyltransferase